MRIGALDRTGHLAFRKSAHVAVAGMFRPLYARNLLLTTTSHGRHVVRLKPDTTYDRASIHGGRIPLVRGVRLQPDRGLRCDEALLDEDRIAELVGEIAARFELRARAPQRSRRWQRRAADRSGCCPARACRRGSRARREAGSSPRSAWWRRRRRRGRCRHARPRLRARARPWSRPRRCVRRRWLSDGSRRRPPRESSTARRTAAARSSSVSPVDEIPAAWVSVTNPMPRSRSARIDAQSSAKPADGGSNAAGTLAIGVHTSHNSSGAATCAY